MTVSEEVFTERRVARKRKSPEHFRWERQASTLS